MFPLHLLLIEVPKLYNLAGSSTRLLAGWLRWHFRQPTSSTVQKLRPPSITPTYRDHHTKPTERRPPPYTGCSAIYIIPMGRTDDGYAWFCVWFDKRRKKAGRRDPSFSFARRFRAHTTLRSGFVRRQSTFPALMCRWWVWRACIWWWAGDCEWRYVCDGKSSLNGIWWWFWLFGMLRERCWLWVCATFLSIWDSWSCWIVTLGFRYS